MDYWPFSLVLAYLSSIFSFSPKPDKQRPSSPRSTGDRARRHARKQKEKKNQAECPAKRLTAWRGGSARVSPRHSSPRWSDVLVLISQPMPLMMRKRKKLKIALSLWTICLLMLILALGLTILPPLTTYLFDSSGNFIFHLLLSDFTYTKCISWPIFFSRSVDNFQIVLLINCLCIDCFLLLIQYMLLGRWSGYLIVNFFDLLPLWS